MIRRSRNVNRSHPRTSMRTPAGVVPVMVLSVVHIREAGETCRKAFADRRLADVPPAPRIWSARHLEDTVVGEVAHDRVQIVLIERGEEFFQSRFRDGRSDGHGIPRLE